MAESSDKMWPTGEGNGKPFQYSCLEKPMNNMKRQKDMTLKDELSKLVLSSFCVRRDVFKDKGREIPDRCLYDLVIEIL